jgi:hypothetical protein
MISCPGIHVPDGVNVVGARRCMGKLLVLGVGFIKSVLTLHGCVVFLAADLTDNGIKLICATPASLSSMTAPAKVVGATPNRGTAATRTVSNRAMAYATPLVSD